MPVISIVSPMNLLIFGLVFLYAGFCASLGMWLRQKIVKD